MKKISILILALFILFTSLTGCDDDSSSIEKGADVITIYIRHFEDWSDEYFINAINVFKTTSANSNSKQNLLLYPISILNNHNLSSNSSTCHPHFKIIVFKFSFVKF